MRRVLCLLGICAWVTAQDLRTPGEEVLAGIKQALREARSEEAVKLLGEVGGLYRYPASPEEAKALLQAAGDAARARDPAVAKAALRALGETRSPDAGQHIEPLLRQLKPTPQQRELALAALWAAARTPSSVLVQPLVAQARKGYDLTLAEEAFKALGGFHAAPPDLRARVADQLLTTALLVSRKSQRWRRLRAPALMALQQVIGRPLNNVRQFTEWWAVARNRADPFTTPSSPAGK